MAIASCLIDTNIFLRMTRRADPHHHLVDTALGQLAGQGTRLHYTQQNIAELWNAMTRPLDRNGFGLTVIDAEREVRAIEAGMILLPDSEAIYHEWRRIVVQYSVLGVQVHDARLAAAMYVHRVGHILTLNTSDFKRFHGLVAVHPDSFVNEKRRLEDEFDNDMRQILEKERDLRYHSTYFQNMLNELGGVEMAHRLLRKQDLPPMFGELRKQNRLDLSLEYYVVMEKYKTLFSDDEREIARFRLKSGD